MNSHHTLECDFLKESGIGCRLNEEIFLYETITPLRFLLLKKKNITRFKQCMKLSNNMNVRQKQPNFDIYREKARKFAEIFNNLTDENEILNILTILDTNTFQVLAAGTAENLGGLYVRASKLNHRCVPSARTVFCSDYSIKIIASISIKKSEPIFISYTPPFYTTKIRNSILEKGKQFTCKCLRCKDPTELGTMISGIICATCKSNVIRDGENETYGCHVCKDKNSFVDYDILEQKYFAIQNKLVKNSVDGLINIINDYSGLVHENHALLLEARQHLSAAIGRAPGYRYDQISEKHLQLKVTVSQKLLEIISVLEPGISKSRGITLLELTEAKSRLLLLNCKDESELFREFSKIKEMLEECCEILQFEDEKAIEGNVAKEARTQYAKIRSYLGSLQGKIVQT